MRSTSSARSMDRRRRASIPTSKATAAGASTISPYRGGMTVAEAVKAGVPRGYVAWDVAHGFITLKPEG